MNIANFLKTCSYGLSEFLGAEVQSLPVIMLGFPLKFQIQTWSDNLLGAVWDCKITSLKRQVKQAGCKDLSLSNL